MSDNNDMRGVVSNAFECVCKNSPPKIGEANRYIFTQNLNGFEFNILTINADNKDLRRELAACHLSYSDRQGMAMNVLSELRDKGEKISSHQLSKLAVIRQITEADNKKALKKTGGPKSCPAQAKAKINKQIPGAARSMAARIAAKSKKAEKMPIPAHFLLELLCKASRTDANAKLNLIENGFDNNTQYCFHKTHPVSSLQFKAGVDDVAKKLKQQCGINLGPI